MRNNHFAAITSVMVFTLAMGGGYHLTQRGNPDETSMSSHLTGENFGKPDENIVNQFRGWLRLLPKDAQKAWLDYVRRVSKIHSGSNESIESANWELTKGPCFSDLAADFYGWLLTQDANISKFGMVQQNNGHPLGSRPSLKDEAGSGIYKNVQPGIVWEKALKVSAGNPNLAMALIGLCGHDDAVTEKPTLQGDRTATARYREVKKALLEKTKQEFLSQMKKENIHSTVNAEASLNEFIEFISYETSDENINRIFCVNSSILYLPKALGPNVDISQNLKARISHIQAPTAGPTALPAKAYHIIGSAMNACLLKSQTSTSIAALVINPMAARLYRAMTLAPRIENRLSENLSHVDPDQISEQSVAPLVDAYNALPRRSDENPALPSAEERAFLEDPKNSLALLFPSLSEEEPLTPKKAKDIAIKKISVYDAATLARAWWMKYQLPVVGTVYLPSAAYRPEARNIGLLNFWELSKMDRCEQPGWSKARCERAIKVLDSWEVDFKWTQEQHYIGASFGWSNCVSLNSNQSIESLACQALNRSSLKPIESAETTH